ncbi:MAG: protein-glutamate O-methyltransferase CheR [Velocimicrobium sp.]
MITITENEFKQLADYIRVNYGINLKKEKTIIVSGRLEQVLQEMKCNTYTEYFNYLMADKSGQAVITLLNKITTNHTFFMRESEHFDCFKNTVLPKLKDSVDDKDMRIWCAASSSGEEAYTLAMIIDEFLGKEKLFWNAQILATDISENALNLAIKGIYSNEKMDALPLYWIQNYFQKYDDNNWAVSERIKQEVIFRKFNLMEEVFPFRKKFHVIFCRNVMIYFDQETKNQLIKKLFDQLEYGGYLFVGHSESIDRLRYDCQYIMPSVYKKI